MRGRPAADVRAPAACPHGCIAFDVHVNHRGRCAKPGCTGRHAVTQCGTCARRPVVHAPCHPLHVRRLAASPLYVTTVIDKMPNSNNAPAHAEATRGSETTNALTCSRGACEHVADKTCRTRSRARRGCSTCWRLGIEHAEDGASTSTRTRHVQARGSAGRNAHTSRQGLSTRKRDPRMAGRIRRHGRRAHRCRTPRRVLLSQGEALPQSPESSAPASIDTSGVASQGGSPCCARSVQRTRRREPRDRCAVPVLS